VKRLGVLTAALVAMAGASAVAPAVSSAAECGPGTVYDPQSDMCVVGPAPANPAPAPANPVEWNAPAPPPPLPPISICPPIPFVAVCFPVN
jgi:hypothetical protein